MTIDDIRAGNDGALHSADDVFLNPIQNAKVFVIGLETQTVSTDASGYFELFNLPAGNVKLVVDGRSGRGIAGFWPEMVLDLELIAGQQNTVMGTMGTPDERLANVDRLEVYLPRLSPSIFKSISAQELTTVELEPSAAPNLTSEQRSHLRLEVKPGSLVDEHGQPVVNPVVGLSTVPPELVREMLPPGVLQHTFDITIQAPNTALFNTPLQITFPNVFLAAPGTKLNFLSFDHTTGRLVIEGTATVSADGRSVTSDVGTGITKPGWHGLTTPGSSGSGPTRSNPDGTCLPKTTFRNIAVEVARCLENVPELRNALSRHHQALDGIEDILTQLNELKKAYDSGIGREQLISRFQKIELAKASLDTLFANLLSDPLIARAQQVVECMERILEEAQTLCDQFRGLDSGCGALQKTLTVCEGVEAGKTLRDQVVRLISDARSTPLSLAMLSNRLSVVREQLGLPPPNTSQLLIQANLVNGAASALLPGLGAAINDAIEATVQQRSSIETNLDAAEKTLSLGDAVVQTIGDISVIEVANYGAPENAFYVVDVGGNALRGKTDGNGMIDVFLPPLAEFHVSIYDPLTNRFAVHQGMTSDSGQPTVIPAIAFVPATGAPDRDRDGLPDAAEHAIGTSPDQRDSDRDGIYDLTEIQQQTDPQSGQFLATGIRNTTRLAGEAKEVVVYGSRLNGESTLAVVATGLSGLAIVDVSLPAEPIVLSQIQLEGDSVDVAISSSLELAIVASKGGGIHFVDIRDSTNPILLRTIFVQATEIEVIEGVAIAAVDGLLRSYDLGTGQFLQSYQVGESPLVALSSKGSLSIP